jgi:hypothetical protein
MDPEHAALNDLLKVKAIAVPLPEPRPGLVIRYDYLWSREAAGREQGKERPACFVAAMDPNRCAALRCHSSDHAHAAR